MPASSVETSPGTRSAAAPATAADTGLRFCGMEDEPPRPGAAGSKASADLGLHEQGHVARDLAQGAGEKAHGRSGLGQAIAVRVPGKLGDAQAQLLGQEAVTRGPRSPSAARFPTAPPSCTTSAAGAELVQPRPVAVRAPPASPRS